MNINDFATGRVSLPHVSPAAASAQYGAIAWLLVTGLAATAFSVPLNHLSPIFGITVHALIALAIMARRPAYAPAVAIFVLLFQNLFVSMFSPEIADKNELNFVRGYNFLVTTMLWLAAYAEYLLGAEAFDPLVRRIMRATNWTIGVVGLYFLYGLTQEGSAAIIYFRNIMVPIFLFQLALLTSSRSSERITPLLIAIGVVLFVCGYVELLFRESWFSVTNSQAYWGFSVADGINSGQFERDMKQTGQVFRDFRDMFHVDAFNTPLLDGFGFDKILRLNGPNMSVIGFGYALAFFALFLMANRKVLLGCLAIPLLVFVSAKGPIVVMLFVVAGWAGTKLIGPKPTLALFGVGLAGYALIAITVGLQSGDYHVIGFMGGLNGFMSAPWGRGLGIGGNLATDFAKIDWGAAQSAGATQGAVESAIGVLLYQMGVAAAVPLALFCWIGLMAWQYFARSGIAMQGLAAFGTLTIVVNGIFQEEALFSPPALGFMLCLAGLCIGRAIRSQDALVRPESVIHEQAISFAREDHVPAYAFSGSHVEVSKFSALDNIAPLRITDGLRHPRARDQRIEVGSGLQNFGAGEHHITDADIARGSHVAGERTPADHGAGHVGTIDSHGKAQYTSQGTAQGTANRTPAERVGEGDAARVAQMQAEQQIRPFVADHAGDPRSTADNIGEAQPLGLEIALSEQIDELADAIDDALRRYDRQLASDPEIQQAALLVERLRLVLVGLVDLEQIRRGELQAPADIKQLG